MKNKIDKYTSNKLKWVNFIACIMIVILHSTKYKYFEVTKACAVFLDYFGKYLPQTGVPLFFVLSGILMFKDIKPAEFTLEIYVNKIKKRCVSLMMPFFAYNVLSIAVRIIEQKIPYIFNHMNSVVLFNYNLKDVVEGLFLFKYNGVAWYLFVLFILDLVLFPVISSFKSEKSCIEFLAICGVLTCMPIELGGITSFLTYYNSAFYFSLGAWIALWHFDIVSRNYERNSMLLATVVLAVSTYIIGITSSNSFYVPILMILRMVNLCCVWVCTDAIKFIKVPKFATITFFVYMMHAEFQKSINKVFEILLPNQGDIYALLNTALGVLITYGLLYCVALFMQKYAKRLWWIANGGR